MDVLQSLRVRPRPEHILDDVWHSGTRCISDFDHAKVTATLHTSEKTFTLASSILIHFLKDDHAPNH